MEQTLGNICGLVGYCGKELRGRRVPEALAVRDGKSPPVLSWWKLSGAPKIQGNDFGSKANIKCVWEECWPRERSLGKKVPQTKGVVG